MNLIEAFELKTIEVQVSSTETDKVPAHCYGDLATFRVDNYLRASEQFPIEILQDIELWSIVLQSNGCLFPCSPMFKTLDDAANFIYGANLLCNSWARARREVYERHHTRLMNLMCQYDGYPLVDLLQHLPDFEENTEEPGVRMNLNGYRPDP